MTRSTISIALFVWLTSSVSAQTQTRGDLGTEFGLRTSEFESIVRGQVFSESPLLGALSVDLCATYENRPLFSVPLNDNEFEFRDVPAGQYRLRISGSSGQPIHEELLSIGGGPQFLSIRLPRQPDTRQADSATVSVHQLQHKVPADAQKAYEKGRRAVLKGDQQTALEDFAKASAIDPQFAEVHNDLGAAYVARREYQKAADEFQKTIDLVPDHSMALANLTVVLFELGKFHETEEAARKALKLAPGQLKLRYILGVSLVAEGGDQAEALVHLQRSASEVPAARLVAAQILARNGDRGAAVHQVEGYLQSAPKNQNDRAMAEALLAALRH